MADLFDNYSHQRPDVTPQIYVFNEPSVHALDGMVCVGYTTHADVNARIQQEFKNAPIKQWNVLFTAPAIRDDGTSFMDHEVHAVLRHMGYPAQPSHTGSTSEWFRADLRTIKAAIVAVQKRQNNVEQRTETFGMRPEQQVAVNKTEAYFRANPRNEQQGAPKFLWNCKMRFGKTFAAYELAKKMGMKRVLILTFKPAVEDSWDTDLMTHVDFEGWQFYSRNTLESPEQLDQSRPIVCFGSFQDYLGTNESGGIKAKNEWVHTTPWDMVIFDEYHFGAWRENARRLFDQPDDESALDFDADEYQKDEAGNAINETWLPITTDCYLFLSGTPFRALNSGEFLEDEIYSWTYSDEQKAKQEWVPSEHNNQTNPYAALPRVVMMTYKMPDDITSIAMNTQYNEFDLNLFFKADSETGKVEDAQFIYKDYVQKWLDLIRGGRLASSIDDLKLGHQDRPVMPFSDARMLNILTHTLWFLPNVASCYAMKNLLSERQNTFYSDYKVNVCAGTEAGVGLDALEPVIQSMADPLKSKTITLSCGKLTTGVTIRPWTGVFMLRNLSSPETYFQTAFRCQSPWTMKDDNGNVTILKEDCYILDFALDRALKEVSDYSCRLNVSESDPEKKVGEFINFLPILAYDGATMKPISASDVLDIAIAGTSATLLARRWESALLVNVDNDTLLRLRANPEAMKALMSIEGFRSLNQDIQTIINRSEHVKKAKQEGKELTPTEKKELSAEEKEFKSLRKQIQEKLIKFATRIPIFMYLTDYREASLKDVITQLEPGLFKKVTGLTVKDFELLVSLGLFNDQLMNESVYKFRRYESASLEYAGIRMHSDEERVGLFSTSISRKDYDELAKLQGLSTTGSPAASKVSEPAHESEPVTASNEPHTSVQPVTDQSPKAEPKHAPKAPQIKVGDDVHHKVFGDGFIISVDIKNNHFRVQFSDSGTVKTFGYPNAFTLGFIELR
ncbi:MAG: restriction endonuclease [Prevotella sp.]|jgi:hypothetical protein|nr:restriction endonuclease [Prevotella sp.]